MVTVSVQEARNRFGYVLDRVMAGEEVTILRRGKAVARIAPVIDRCAPLPDLSDFRSSIQVAGQSLRAAVLEERSAACS